MEQTDGVKVSGTVILVRGHGGLESYMDGKLLIPPPGPKIKKHARNGAHPGDAEYPYPILVCHESMVR